MKKAKSSTSKSVSVSKFFPLTKFFSTISTDSTVSDMSKITNDKTPIPDFQALNSEHNVDDESVNSPPCSSSMLFNLHLEINDNINDDNDNHDFELSQFGLITNTASHSEITGNNTSNVDINAIMPIIQESEEGIHTGEKENVTTDMQHPYIQ